MNYYATLKQKGYDEPFIYQIREKFKNKFKLWAWDSIEPEQMKEVEAYVNSLPNKND